MTEWTVERLDALPEGTVIEWLDSGVELTAVKQEEGRWHLVRHTYYEYPEDIIEEAAPGSIRVVSVPIDALLADEAVHAWDMHPADAYETIRAAVEHVIGETL